MFWVLIELGFRYLYSSSPVISPWLWEYEPKFFKGCRKKVVVLTSVISSAGHGDWQVAPYPQPLSFLGGLELWRGEFPVHINEVICPVSSGWNHGIVEGQNGIPGGQSLADFALC